LYWQAHTNFHSDVDQNIYENQQIIDRQQSQDKTSRHEAQSGQNAGQYESANRYAEGSDPGPYTELREAFDGRRSLDSALPRNPQEMASSGRYEEPWNLEAAQFEMEDQFSDVIVGEWILSERPANVKEQEHTDLRGKPIDPNEQIGHHRERPSDVRQKHFEPNNKFIDARNRNVDPRKRQTDARDRPPDQSALNLVSPHGKRPSPSISECGPSLPAESDIRTQTGYEKPWDWKPHLKDDRALDGYERPWDLKPHQKDDRPPSEYEDPWDKKLKNVEGDLIAAKIAKESCGRILSSAANERRVGGSDSPAVVTSPPTRSYADDIIRGQDGYEKPWDLKPHQRDDRPHSDYEPAWDGKDVEGDIIAAKIAKEASRLADGMEQRRGYKLNASAAIENSDRIQSSAGNFNAGRQQPLSKDISSRNVASSNSRSAQFGKRNDLLCLI